MLISEQYKALIAQKHVDSPGWGTTGRNHAGMVARIVADYAPMNILDYGCGKQSLARALPQYRIKGYDPGLPGLDTPPEPHDLVVCTDVLEHVEEDCLEDVLDDLQRVTRKNLYVDVSTVPAFHDLPDGRNAHLVIQPCRWWIDRLWKRFDLISVAIGSSSFQALFSAINPKGNGGR